MGLVGATSTRVWRLTRMHPPTPRLFSSPLGPPTQTAAMGVDDGLFALHHWVISGTFLSRYTRRFIRQTGYCLVELTKNRDTYGTTGTITAGFCVLERMIRHQPGGRGEGGVN